MAFFLAEQWGANPYDLLDTMTAAQFAEAETFYRLKHKWEVTAMNQARAQQRATTEARHA